MYEKLATPLLDMEAYIRRLGYETAPVPSLETLDDLIYRHQCEIAFENLDAYEKKECPSLEMDALFQKIIQGKRGGWCFELNALFTQLLTELGFDAFSVSARIIRGKDFIPPMLHRGILVRFADGLYYCDVGYGGPQPGYAVPLGGHRAMRGENFACEEQGGSLWRLNRQTEAGEWESVLEFWDIPMAPSYYIPLNYYTASHQDSVFTQVRMLNRRTETGHLSLTGTTLTIRENGTETRTTVEEREVPDIMEQYFGIETGESIS